GGKFSGALTPTSANITNTYDAPTSQSIHLGSSTYTVTLGTYIAPGAPGSTTTGSIGAHVDVLADSVPTPAPPPVPQPAAEAPEPSSLVLASLGLLGLSRCAWRSRRSRRAG